MEEPTTDLLNVKAFSLECSVVEHNLHILQVYAWGMIKASDVWQNRLWTRKEKVLFHYMKDLYFVSRVKPKSTSCVHIMFRWSLHLFSFSCFIVDIVVNVGQMLKRNCVSHCHGLQQKCQLTNSTIFLHVLHYMSRVPCSQNVPCMN